MGGLSGLEGSAGAFCVVIFDAISQQANGANPQAPVFPGSGVLLGFLRGSGFGCSQVLVPVFF